MTAARTSIRRKLALIALATAAVGMLLQGIAMSYHDLRRFREAAVADLEAQADIIGIAAAPALEFGDPQAARDYLAALEGKPMILGAAIYTAKGAVLASYTAPGRERVDFPALPAQDGYRLAGDRLEVTRRIVSGREIIGTVHIRAHFDAFGRMMERLVVLAGVMALCLTLAMLAANRLQRLVTQPIQEITAVARDVMDRRDYSARARKTTEDELGVLVDAFNGMLADIAHEISHRQRAEDALQASEARLLALNAELERRVEARTAELEAANKDLEGFSYSVSHDLRAPIRAVGGFAALLAEDHGGELNDEARRKIAIIRSEAERMGQLIDDLLAFSRLGRTALEPARLDMTAMVRAVYERLNHSDAARPIDFQLGSLPRARGDRRLFEQVWMNLLSNAIKFSGKKDRPVIEVGGLSGERELIYYVRDNGAGFDPRYQAKLFGVFQRLHRDEEFPGTGVGLALVQRIVTRHGGRIWADGKPGQGATFHFSLPKEPDDG